MPEKIFQYSAEGERPDQKKLEMRHKLLGRKLPQIQQIFYNVIYLSGTKPISAAEIYHQVYNTDGICADNNRDRVWTLINRIRDRLGTNALITVHYKGYLARRAVIEAQVEKNISKAVS